MQPHDNREPGEELLRSNVNDDTEFSLVSILTNPIQEHEFQIAKNPPIVVK